MTNGSITDSVHTLGTTTARWLNVYTDGLAVDASALSGLIVDPTTGVITIHGVASSTSVSLDVGGSRAMLIPRISTATRDALTAVNGMLIYNTTANKLQVRENGAWTEMGSNFQAQRSTFITDAINGTQTAFSVAGPGRLLSLYRLGGAGGNTGSAEISIAMDGTTLMTHSGTTNMTGGTWVVKNLQYVMFNDSPETNTAVSGFGGAVDGYLGWGFEASMTIYIDTNPGAGASGGSSTIVAIYEN